MDSTVVTALAAALGSLVGATASIGTTWLSQTRQSIRATAEWKLRERESLYKEFIMEASRLFGDAMVNTLDRPDQLVALYGILSRIRHISGDEVLSTAVGCCHRIVGLYRRPNMTAEQIRAAFEANEFDPLKEFSAACRMELLAMSSIV
jgi:hypothetical protein